MRQTLTGILFTVLTGCVTTHYGQEYSLNEGRLVFSCSKDGTIDHPYIKSISCAIENTGATWINVKVDSFAAQSIDPNNSLAVLNADQIQSFLNAHQFEVEKNSYNTDLILAGLVVGGAVASGSSNASIETAGLATALGAVAVGAANEATDEYHKAQGNRYEYSKHHLLGPEFEIPPGSFVRKTILIQTSEDSSFKAWPKKVELCFVKPESQCQSMNFWNPRG